MMIQEFLRLYTMQELAKLRDQKAFQPVAKKTFKGGIRAADDE